MSKERKKHNWKAFFRFFTEENRGRATRLGVFEGADDYWIESGLPLTGVDIDDLEELPAVEIMLSDYTHAIRNAMQARIILSHSGEEDGLDVTDSAGVTTVLRFETDNR